MPEPSDGDAPPIELIGEDLRGARLRRVNLHGASFRDVDLSDVRMRGVWLAGADIDGDLEGLRIWGVEVLPLLEAELTRRHPERAVMEATEPADLAAGWTQLEEMWSATIERVAALPPETVDVSVDGEWSFAQTLRHLLLATDAWLGKAILDRASPFHPLGVLFGEFEGREADFGLDADARPTFAEVLDARAGRVALVRAYLASVTTDELAFQCLDPWGGGWTPSVLDCLRVIFNEEWHHHRYAVRDLDILAGLDSTRSDDRAGE